MLEILDHLIIGFMVWVINKAQNKYINKLPKHNNMIISV